MTYKAFDVVTVPFPFTDAARKKKRPAVVISSRASFNEESGHSVLAMITSAKNRSWPLDVPLKDLKSAGLSAESVIRMKVFTLDHRFILDTIGSLSVTDRKSVSRSVSILLAECLV